MNSYFIVSVVSIFAAVCIVGLKVCYASKCDDINLCWGLIHIEREVRYEDSQLADGNGISKTPPYIRQMKNVKNNQLEGQCLPEEFV